VTGVDVSAGAGEGARRRAELSGVAGTTSFVCSPIEAMQPAAGFDVIWFDNVIHHLLAELDGTLRTLSGAAKPGAVFLAIEPVNLSPALRRIRFLVPVHTEVTPGERPLEAADLAVIRKYVPDVQRRHFQFLARLMRFVLPCLQYEHASLPRRALCDGLAALDRGLLSLPGLDVLGAMAVMHGHFAA
jgi:SAM-dependent methyltransferase